MIAAAATKFECFCLDPTETWLFAGNASGEVLTIAVDGFSIHHAVQAHSGVVQALASHKRLPYIAALSTDRHVSVWGYDDDGRLHSLCKVPLRGLRPKDEEDCVAAVHSTSQAIAFHDSELRVVTRTGNAALLELDISASGDWKVRRCVRLHGDADLITARYVSESDAVLSGSIDGQLALSQDGEVLRRWQVGSGNLHWIEHVEGTTYLLASDMRYVARIDIADPEGRFSVGPQFTRDDLEHVNLNTTSGRVLVGSFDRTVYEIDALNCQPTRAAFQAPFKCRWVSSLRRDPALAVVQCRNGALYKVDIDTGAMVAELRSTPSALWTCVEDAQGSILMAGEGSSVTRLRSAGEDPVSRTHRFEQTTTSLPLTDVSSTKRAAIDPESGAVFLGRLSGTVYEVQGASARVLAELGSAVRDLTLDTDERVVFVACEDGSVHKLDTRTGEELERYSSESGQPLWSLAFNPMRRLLAVGERAGTLLILDSGDFSLRATGIPTARPKRMKWLNDDILLFNYKDEIRRFDLYTGERDVLVGEVGNTIEDFIWSEDWGYLVFIGYTQNLYLADLWTGEVINWVPDQLDYSKGLTWVPSQPDVGYPLDLLTFGRSGSAHYFRIHDEKLLAYGPLVANRLGDQGG